MFTNAVGKIKSNNRYCININNDDKIKVWEADVLWTICLPHGGSILLGKMLFVCYISFITIYNNTNIIKSKKNTMKDSSLFFI